MRHELWVFAVTDDDAGAGDFDARFYCCLDFVEMNDDSSEYWVNFVADGLPKGEVSNRSQLKAVAALHFFVDLAKSVLGVCPVIYCYHKDLGRM